MYLNIKSLTEEWNKIVKEDKKKAKKDMKDRDYLIMCRKVNSSMWPEKEK
jgi:hypothetical protein